jgi:hypothetical protein
MFATRRAIAVVTYSRSAILESSIHGWSGLDSRPRNEFSASRKTSLLARSLASTVPDRKVISTEPTTAAEDFPQSKLEVPAYPSDRFNGAQMALAITRSGDRRRGLQPSRKLLIAHATLACDEAPDHSDLVRV